MMAAVAYLASSGYAQDAAVTPGADDPKPSGISQVLNLVLRNIDAVFVVIILLSITALTLIISSVLRLRQSAFMPEQTIGTIRGMIENRQFKELIDYTEVDNSFVARAINPALKRAPSFSAMKEAMETSIGEQSAEQFRKIEYLNIIGNLGPLLGLLGTVLGMIDAFSDMERAKGQADPAILAGGISKALAHTFMGLFLAVPSLAAFGVLRTVVDRLTVRASLVCEELLLMIKPPDAKPGVTPTRPPGTPTPAPP
ncbi:MAG: MotA/TolQ/ExbB proton channel family protein, partial [Burkholderiales bacterium]|nr:MotA/TolQ/ExbB proton channel family protein [Phycisphaerae bacterium]